MTRKSSHKTKKTAKKKAPIPPQTEREIATKLRAFEAATKPEPTFTLADVSKAFGQNYGGAEHANDPIYFALNALEDVKKHLYLLSLALHSPGDDGTGAEDVLTQTWHRTGAAVEVLEKCRRAAKASEVQS